MPAIATPATSTSGDTNADKAGHAAHTGRKADRPSLPGEFLRPIKVTMIGAGSHFTHPLMSDIIGIPGADRGEIALVDIEENRLGPMAEITRRLIDHYGKSDGWTVTATTDRLEVLKGTDYLINSIDVGGGANVRHDNDIPLKYGIDQCIGDTIGPGGLFKILRTAPVWLDILRDAAEHCPQALVLNYTNPMNIMCLAAGRAVPQMPVVGLCHSTFLTLAKLCRALDIDEREVRYRNAGINHLAWFTELEHKGEDLYPRLFELVKDRTGEVYESDPVRFDMMLHFGAFITESSGHLSEYLPYYRKTPAAVKEFCRDGYRGGSSFYADNWPSWRKGQDEGRDAVLRGEEPLARDRSKEYASWIIEAREKDSPCRIHGNVMNRPHDPTSRGPGTDPDSARLISNLPADGCVEVAIMIDRNGLNPCRFGALPPQMAAICRSNMAMFDLAATACVEGSREAAKHALMLDPLTAAVCTATQISEMFDEMWDAQKDWLTPFA